MQYLGHHQNRPPNGGDPRLSKAYSGWPLPLRKSWQMHSGLDSQVPLEGLDRTSFASRAQSTKCICHPDPDGWAPKISEA